VQGGVVQRTVQTPDGRVLAVEEAGDPAGRPVLVHNGTPNSRHLYGPDARDAAERGPVDAAALSGELGGHLQTAMRDGLAPSSEGWWDDNCMIRPWGFSLADIKVPFLLLHGRQDMFVPFGHGEWLAARIPGVEARLFDDEGHLSLLQNRVSEVHAWLSDRL
jgi:pimeloyl-ACP methyl ester carboxylesterase